MYRRKSDTRPNDIELQDLGSNGGADSRPVPLDRSDPLSIGTEVNRSEQAQHQRDCRRILVLSSLAAVLVTASAVLGFLYISQLTQPPDIQNLTITASTTESFTEFRTKPRTTTAIILQPTTETVISTLVTTQIETTTRKARTSSVTTLVTTTIYLTSTQTTSTSASSSRKTSLSPRCIPPALYGGEELHQLSVDYDILIASTLALAASQGLDIGGQDPLLVSLRSIFTCVAEEDLLLAAACETGYVRIDSIISCDGAAYATASSQVLTPTAAWTSSLNLPEVIPTTANTTTITPVTKTKTTDVVLTRSAGAT